MRGENLFLTGAAGTGKSYLLRYLVQELEALHPGKVAVTAPTGIAAANIGGQTIHSFAGVGLGEGSVGKLLNKVKKSSAAVSRWKGARVLVIDEISMLDANLFAALETIAASVRGVREGRCLAPFGGLQLLLCGDFLQLPPVPNRHARQQKQFCFQAPSWARCRLDAGTVILRESVRQAGDDSFAAILNEIRLGSVSARADEMLAECHVDRKPAPDDGIIPTKLYCLNRNVDAENKKQLSKLAGETKSFRARDCFKGARNARQREMLQDMMEKKVPAELSLKVGAQVILTKNNPTLKLVNGSRGVVESFSDRFPLVRFDSGVCARIGQEPTMQGTSASSLTRVQVPLKLGWALTVHKAQGMTLTRAEVQVDDAFEAGQVYVALSRLTGTAGLWIRGSGLSRANTRASDTVLDFYGMPLLAEDAVPLAQARAAELQRPGQSRKKRPLAVRPIAKRCAGALTFASSQLDAGSASSAPPASLDVPAKRQRLSGAGDDDASFAELVIEVLRLKRVADDLGSCDAAVLRSLGELRALGPLPTEVLRATLVGRSVAALARRPPEAGGSGLVRDSARSLEEAWRREHRLRQQRLATIPSPIRSAAPALWEAGVPEQRQMQAPAAAMEARGRAVACEEPQAQPPAGGAPAFVGLGHRPPPGARGDVIAEPAPSQERTAPVPSAERPLPSRAAQRNRLRLQRRVEDCGGQPLNVAARSAAEVPICAPAAAAAVEDLALGVAAAAARNTAAAVGSLAERLVAAKLEPPSSSEVVRRWVSPPRAWGEGVICLD